MTFFMTELHWIALEELSQLENIKEQSSKKPVVIFKHSTRCGISRMVLRQFENEYNSGEKFQTYLLDLLKHREISNEIATQFEVVHQSPQLLIIDKGVVVYHASHDAVVAEELEKYIVTKSNSQ